LAEVEKESAVQLVFKTGGLDLKPLRDGHPESINQYAGSMRAAGMPFEELSAEAVMDRFPQSRLDEDVRAPYQAESGLVDAGKANAVHAALARSRGATILDSTPVRSIRTAGDGVEVLTEVGTFSCRRLIIAAGAWTNEVLGHVGVELLITLTQEQVTYFRTPYLREFAPGRFPIWIWHGGPRETFYGVPVYGEVATKADQDVGGDEVTLETRTFEPNFRVSANVRRFLERYIPRSLCPELFTKTCLYDMPPDRDFVLDTLPEHPQILLAVGAGHAFKFAGLMGKILSELALDDKSSYPIEAFRMNRPALIEPDYEPVFAM
jgi:sarcosine oxidase